MWYPGLDPGTKWTLVERLVKSEVCSSVDILVLINPWLCKMLTLEEAEQRTLYYFCNSCKSEIISK